MLLWLGVCSVWRGDDFWTSPNLLAGAIYPRAAFRTGLEWNTVCGVSLYVLLYGLLGTLFALAASRPITRFRLALIAAAFGLGWYWITFRWLWRAVPPLAALFQGGPAAVLGHLLYGALLARFPRYLPAAVRPETTAPVAEQDAAMNSGTPAD
jgi:hypothetical protein